MVGVTGLGRLIAEGLERPQQRAPGLGDVQAVVFGNDQTFLNKVDALKFRDGVRRVLVLGSLRPIHAKARRCPGGREFVRISSIMKLSCTAFLAEKCRKRSKLSGGSIRRERENGCRYDRRGGEGSQRAAGRLRRHAV